MPRRITDACTCDASCVDVCPVDCISPGDIYVIDEDACIDCGACQAVCPSDAIIEV